MAVTQLEKQVKALKRDLDRLQADFGKLTNDTGRAARQASDTAHEASATALAKLEEEATRLLDALKGAGHSVVEGGEDVVTGVHDQIQERPLIAAAAAMGLGLVVGMVIARRR
jgi:ElaB/YqjD/DUF883 family membrane-anchored ribosome-binding protein